MHVQLLKEWRLLRPGLVAAIGLALLPLVLPVAPEIRDERGYFLAFGLFLGGVLLAIEAFGAEFHQRTSTLWLALPQPRAGLWRSKLAMTGLAVATAVLVHWMALVAGAPWRGGLPNLIEFVRPMVAILGGAALGLFWSVQLRQTWAAFWMSLIVPGALALLIQLLLALFSPMPENDQAARALALRWPLCHGFLRDRVWSPSSWPGVGSSSWKTSVRWGKTFSLSCPVFCARGRRWARSGNAVR